METPDNYILRVSNLTVEISNQRIIDNLSFRIKKGVTLAVVGPNGAGKTTLFRAMLNLVPYKGKIEWNGKVKVGYVPQILSVRTAVSCRMPFFFSCARSSFSIFVRCSVVWLISERAIPLNLDRLVSWRQSSCLFLRPNVPRSLSSSWSMSLRQGKRGVSNFYVSVFSDRPYLFASFSCGCPWFCHKTFLLDTEGLS